MVFPSSWASLSSNVHGTCAVLPSVEDGCKQAGKGPPPGASTTALGPANPSLPLNPARTLWAVLSGPEARAPLRHGGELGAWAAPRAPAAWGHLPSQAAHRGVHGKKQVHALLSRTEQWVSVLGMQRADPGLNGASTVRVSSPTQSQERRAPATPHPSPPLGFQSSPGRLPGLGGSTVPAACVDCLPSPGPAAPVAVAVAVGYPVAVLGCGGCKV